MGLLTLLRKIKTKEKELRILILGLDNAGERLIDFLRTGQCG
jgi:ADP-ribosylation factor-like protein 2